MPGPHVIPVHGDLEPPRKVDVVVVGGGIIGTSTALELAERGLHVALCEKGGIGHEQSSRNWGWVRISRRDPREVPLMAETLKLWENLESRTGCDIGYRRAGILFGCEDDKTFEEHDRWRRHLSGTGLESRMLSREELQAQMPGCRLAVKGALFTPADGRAEPQKVAPAIAEAARAKGAHVLTECAVRGVETEAGRVAGVVTERGRIRCQSVVLAGGAWSNLFCTRHGLDLPQLKVINNVLRTSPLDGPEAAMWASGFALRKRQDGGYTIANGGGNIADIVPDTFRYLRRFLPALKMERYNLKPRLGWRFLDEARIPRQWALDEPSPFEYHRVLDPAPSRRMANEAMEKLCEAFPVFRDANIEQRWAGCIDVTPDAIPVISNVESLPGLVLATGFSGHGFGIGPGAGRLASDLVCNDTPLVDPHAFRFSRFTDGSKVRPDNGFDIGDHRPVGT
ncbi:NAD(P)/FAD-dependent oxidoreductase [Salinicola peritrichatus]|uniref:NAD(P)/FAD-dependent oxidoreductase n=1 Tax=Salinicola peritrichatus TaxID=1267424 RepID=UPI000DA15339|nr:FAD-binding oxidoreductase [Salinicola peritrichatus]